MYVYIYTRTFTIYYFTYMIRLGLKKLFVCHHLTDQTLEVLTQNILLDL